MRRYHRGTVPVLFYKTPTMTRRADRLFQIAELLRGRRLTTAQQLADWLNISLRSIAMCAICNCRACRSRARPALATG
ncbi:hypothetical protein J2W46_004924 [Paraburkholderia strydomiana]|nr:hypothetical protein [Paraburkholderia strydomiana]